MSGKREKLSLFHFIDAFGWEVKQRHPEFMRDLIRDSRPLKTILGYSSACDPSIISGLTPAEHGLWSSFYYDPEGCPYKWARHLRLLPDAVSGRSRVRHQIARLIKRACGFTGYFQIYNVPFGDLPLFNYAEQKRIWEPGGLPHGTSIFDRMSAADIPYFVHDSDVCDETRFAQLEADIKSRRIDFAYCSFGRLDALMHAVGNDHPDIGGLIQWYDRNIRDLLATAEANYREVAWYIFTDHGMHNVDGTCDITAEIETLGLTWAVDYAAFYDATMARFWPLNESAGQVISRHLSTHSEGRLLTEQELRDYGVWFEDSRYGNLIFLMNPGVQIAPGFMGRTPCKGMHGYDPEDADSYASISSNRTLPEPFCLPVIPLFELHFLRPIPSRLT